MDVRRASVCRHRWTACCLLDVGGGQGSNKAVPPDFESSPLWSPRSGQHVADMTSRSPPWTTSSPQCSTISTKPKKQMFSRCRQHRISSCSQRSTDQGSSERSGSEQSTMGPIPAVTQKATNGFSWERGDGHSLVTSKGSPTVHCLAGVVVRCPFPERAGAHD